MRTIKFRAWDKKKKVMRPIYGVLAKIEWDQKNNPFRIGIYEFVQTDENGHGDWDGFELEQDEFELMQYTGLKDKNGKEIYEGDVVVIPAGYGGDKWYEEWIGIIDYDAPEFFINERYLKPFGFQDFEYSETEIIGNIHENPELIK